MTPIDYINIERLPALAQEMVDLLGDALAFKLFKAVGGTTINVPVHCDKTVAIASLLTMDELKTLCAHYHGERLQVPKYDAIARQNIHAKVRALRQKGWAINRIAVHVGYGERQIYNILGETLDPPANYDLFEDLP
jgi:hypothetical protein